MRRWVPFILCFLTQCSYDAVAQDRLCAYVVGTQQCVERKAHSEFYINPASCTKVLTALIALKDLGEDYRFTTKLYRLKNGEGLIEFSGDPTLTSKDLTELLKKYSFKKIYVDATLFKVPEISPNIMCIDVGLWYGAPVSTGIIDQNTIECTFDKQGKVSLKPYYKSHSYVKPGGQTSIRLAWDEKTETVFFYGTVANSLTFKIAPYESSAYVMKTIQGIARCPVVMLKRPYAGAKQYLETHYSKPLLESMKKPFHRSDNLFFDALYLVLLHKHVQKDHLRWDDGDAVMKTLISQYYNVDLENSRFVDGSGLSRYNRVKPRHLFELLQKNECLLRKIMPHMGEKDSSLEKIELPADVVGKLGGMTGVYNLCGYHKERIFVLMMSQFAGRGNLPKYFREVIKLS